MADICFRNRVSERWFRRSVHCISADFEAKLNSYASCSSIQPVENRGSHDAQQSTPVVKPQRGTTVKLTAVTQEILVLRL